jgi:hypothetical protein
LFSLEPLGEIEDLRSLPINTYPVGKVRPEREPGSRATGMTGRGPSDPLVGGPLLDRGTRIRGACAAIRWRSFFS